MEPSVEKAETEEQYAEDVTAFLAWAADPTISERKQQEITLWAIWLLCWACYG